MVASFDVRTALLMGGLTHLITPLAVWAVLQARHNRRSLAFWSVGSALSGLGYCLIALRGMSPDWLSIGFANLISYVGFAYRGRALLLEVSDQPRGRLSHHWPYLAFAAFCLAWTVDERWRVTVNTAVLGGASLWLAVLSFRVAHVQDSRSASLLGWSQGLFGIGALVRSVGLVFWPPVGNSVVFDPSPLFAAWITVGLVAGLYTNVGFIGIGVDSVRRRELQQAADLARHQLLREQAEQHSAALSEQLGREEEVLRLLAHEVRQPLHNAMAVLQGARSGLQQATDPATVNARIRRAERVIHEIVGTLDNTLAATALLASQLPAARHDADIDMLVSMSIADLPPAAQARIRVTRETTTRTASLDPSLMRLALRNLLANACTYAEADSPVDLVIRDQDEPLALVIDIGDQGPGIDGPLQTRLFEAGSRGGHGLPGHGLGLYVVRRVMELHGGSVQWLPNQPRGSIFRLLIPQGTA